MDTATQTYPTYSDEISTTKIGVMVTLNYHIANTDKVDFYFVAGVDTKTEVGNMNLQTQIMNLQQ